MEKIDIKNYLFYDGYDLSNENLKNVNYITDFLKKVNEIVFNNEGQITIIPYFNGKVKVDGGVSGIILGNNFHFTCHSFCYKGTIFIDYYGNDSKKDLVLDLITNNFTTENYDLGCKDKKGNFGKHIIIKGSAILFDEAINKIKSVLKNIDMIQISELLIKNEDKNNFDILQPIAESHISFHQHNNLLVVDVFSCKYFDTEKVLTMFSNEYDVEEINRGIQYK